MGRRCGYRWSSSTVDTPTSHRAFTQRSGPSGTGSLTLRPQDSGRDGTCVTTRTCVVTRDDWRPKGDLSFTLKRRVSTECRRLKERSRRKPLYHTETSPLWNRNWSRGHSFCTYSLPVQLRLPPNPTPSSLPYSTHQTFDTLRPPGRVRRKLVNTGIQTLVLHSKR